MQQDYCAFVDYCAWFVVGDTRVSQAWRREPNTVKFLTGGVVLFASRRQHHELSQGRDESSVCFN